MTRTKPLHEPSTDRGHNLALDGLRGVAVLLVYLFHYGGGLKSSHLVGRLFGQFSAAGWVGVELFFVLSAFLITGILWDSIHDPDARHRLRNFYARRILRIFPLYYATLAICAVAMLATGHNFRETRGLYLYVFFLQDLPKLADAAQHVPTLPLYHFWSLAVEEQFYILWPFLLLIFRTRHAAIRLCLATFSVSVAFCLILFGMRHTFSGQTAHDLTSFVLTHAGAFALGALVAILLRAPRHPKIVPYARVAFVAGLGLYISASLLGHTFALAPRLEFCVGLPAVWLASAATIPLVLHPGLPSRVCSFAPLRFLGRISYGFYVFHLLLQGLFDAIGSHVAHTDSGSYYQFIRLIAGFPITLAVSWVSFELFEFPFLQLKRFFPMRSSIPSA